MWPTRARKGLGWEADPRRAELATQELGLTTARPQLRPGGATAQENDEEFVLDTAAELAYGTVRAGASRLAKDMPELIYATKECGKAPPCSSRLD